MTVDQVSWLLISLTLFTLVFISSGRADNRNRRVLNRLNRGKGNKRK